jgi:NAD(P)-dependent dehydrogenase (short-subunit alcohol dehydrogenase family)
MAYNTPTMKPLTCHRHRIRPTMRAHFTLALTASLALPIPSLTGRNPSLHAQEVSPQRAVLVTGASTGIGRKTAELLASRGFFVYAGARKAADLAELDAIDNMQSIRLDVTIQAEIDAAVETVRAEGRGLYGLINNAGVAVIAPLIEVDEEEMLFQMDVNVMGPYRVTKAFAPLIIESRGRISTTGSLSGFVTWPLGGPYTMSKHAVEAYSDVLATEMASFGVRVSVIEPGNYNSQIFPNLMQRMEERGYTTEGSLYKEQIDGLMSRVEAGLDEPEPDDVAEAFYHAMSDEDPKSHYLVVPIQREAEVTIRAAIRRLVQINEGHEFSYDREALVRMLDEALERSRR